MEIKLFEYVRVNGLENNNYWEINKYVSTWKKYI